MPMKPVLRYLPALAAAILATAALASIAQTQVNLAALAALGAPVSAATRLLVTLQDLAGFGPVMTGIVAAAFMCAMPAGHVIGRRRTRAVRLAVQALAGAAGLWAGFALLALVTPMPALVDATGTAGGLAAVSLTGVVGGLLFAWLAPAAAAAGAMGTGARDRLRAALALAALTIVPGMLFLASAPRPGPAVRHADPAGYVVQVVATGLDRPWSLAFLPDGRTLVTERAGRLLALGRDGARTAIALAGMPPVLREGGAPLMTVAIDPQFAANRLLYLTLGYATSGAPGTPGMNGTRLVRARLDGDRLADVRILFDSTPKASASNNGGALAFLADGTLVMSVGDGQERERAQLPGSHQGKLVRLDREGRAPADNPFAGRPGVAPALYSLGHRNPQGLAFDAVNGILLASDHGPRGGDELGAIGAGGNHGWPVTTGGIDYSFARVTPYRALEGVTAPLLEWTPSIAPGGLAVYDADLFAGWRGDLLVPALKERALRRVRRDGARIVGQELLLAELDERLRDVRVAPDGAIHVLTDGQGARLLRIVPATAERRATLQGS